MTEKFTDYGRWWDSPTEDRFRAYYMLLRVIYQLPALEAFERAKKAFSDYPEFMANPCRTIKKAMRLHERRTSGLDRS